MRPEIKVLLKDMPEYADALEKAASTGDYSLIEARLTAMVSKDDLMKPFDGEDGTKYYKPFHQAAVPKIMEALKTALANDLLPTIKLTFQEIDTARKRLGIDTFGSAQDVLYGFSSERYKHWGPSLTQMGFRSACMAGQAEVLLTLAPRYLELPETADVEITEVEGGITKDFWETANILASNPTLNALFDLIEHANEKELKSIGEKMPPTTKESATAIKGFIQRLLTQRVLNRNQSTKAKLLLQALEDELSQKAPKIKGIFKKDLEMGQEQIGLKYADEGKYVQKLLGGKRIEHLQSNVKMVKNPLRGNKCEVDSIYRVLAEKRLVLLEAKGKNLVSRSQLYQLYETFKLKLPHDWQLTVVVLLLTKGKPKTHGPDVKTVIDLIEINFDDSAFGEITESLAAIGPKVHYRWLIKKPKIIA